MEEKMDKKVMEHFRTPGVFSWNDLMTTDLKAAREFYSGLLGWEYEEMTGKDGSIYLIAKAGGRPVGGMYAKPAHVPVEVPSHWASYITVDDVDAAKAKAMDLGAGLVFDVMHEPGVGRFCGIRDPQGAYLILIAYED
jgi:predicted enzyme related to lactoylglutathione lyase